MFDGSMSESTNKAAVNVRSRLFLALPLVLFAFVALTVGFVASKTLRQPYRTAFRPGRSRARFQPDRRVPA